MPNVIAQLYDGEKPLADYRTVREISSDLPADVIGECVASAVHRAWRAGHDPAHVDGAFWVRVMFT